MSKDYFDIFFDGSKMTRRTADELERKVALCQSDEISRINLMGFYFWRGRRNNADREKSLDHELWFVQNSPGHAYLRYPQSSIAVCDDTALYDRAKSAWLAIVSEDCKDSGILANAAAFFTMRDREFAVSLIERARRIEPSNIELLQQLADIYSLGLSRSDDTWLQRAFEVHRELLEKESGNVRLIARFGEFALKLGDLNTVNQAAQMILASPHAASPSVIYEAHSLLSRMYLREGDIPQAKEELLACGDWPNYNLANEFIGRGESQIVCDYLWRSLPSWKVGKIQLLLWIVQLHLGGKPRLTNTWLLSSRVGGYSKEKHL